jgi:hypothetical protein
MMALAVTLPELAWNLDLVLDKAFGSGSAG